MTAARAFALAALAATLASCRACTTERGSGARADTSSSAPRPAATIDVDGFRLRARVPAIGWATITGSQTTAGAVGSADLEGAQPATAATVFEAASIAKTIIATCVMQLVEENQLSLDADVSSYAGFPVRRPGQRAPITLRHLLTHTSTIVDVERSAAPGGVPLGDFLASYLGDAGAAIFLDASPGTTPAYSNVGASLAALAVERVTGTPFAERARERVFGPLGMTHTAFGRDALPPGARLALPYAARGSAFVRLAIASHALYPVVDLFSTPADLARFGRAILGHGALDGRRVLSAESVAAMLRPQPPDAAPLQGLGWQIRTIGGRRVVGHEGEDAGASTGLYLDLVAGVGAVVLANGDAFQGGEPARAAAIGELLDQLLGAARASSRSPDTLRSTDAD